jgi:hypothetical protein
MRFTQFNEWLFRGHANSSEIAALRKPCSYGTIKSEKKEFAARVGREGDCGRMNEFTLRFWEVVRNVGDKPVYNLGQAAVLGTGSVRIHQRQCVVAMEWFVCLQLVYVHMRFQYCRVEAQVFSLVHFSTIESHWQILEVGCQCWDDIRYYPSCIEQTRRFCPQQRTSTNSCIIGKLLLDQR